MHRIIATYTGVAGGKSPRIPGNVVEMAAFETREGAERALPRITDSMGLLPAILTIEEDA